MLLLVQFSLAVAAIFRGWGLTPVWILVALFSFGRLLGFLGVQSFGVYMTIDFVVAAALLAMVAISPELEE